MSKQVDERIVSMQFDNRHFEKNVSTTMSTLDKLKQKLNLTDSAKGLENVGTAAKKVDMNPLANGVATVSARFSSLQVMAVTALANITNSAVNAAKNIVKSLTIDPVTTGFNEYELKMNSVQTIMASTGESLENVNGYLDELNKYSDQTIYLFSDMTQNIGKFTNAGVKLPDAVAAIKGIANAAALSGANANEASRSMYNFAQALSAGHVKLIDWKSIELANMATVEFKNQLLESAVAAGTLTKTADGMYQTLGGTAVSATKNFNESLQDQWMTTEVLTTTLADYADETTDIGKRATKAATEVKTFSMMLDTLKESAQSGWAQTWEIVFGNFEDGKNLWTSITNFLGGIIDKMSDARNFFLDSALNFSKPWEEITEKLGKVQDKVEGFKKSAKAITDVTDKLKYYQTVVDKVWKGDYNNHGDNPDRFDLLSAEGYDYKVVQSLVDLGEKTKGQYRITTEDVTAAEKKFGVAVAESAKTTEKKAEAIEELTDKQLEEAGLTKEEIRLYRDLQKEADRLGISIEELAKKMSEQDGRTLLIESFKNLGQSILSICTAIKDAWNDMFPPMSIVGLYNAIDAFNKFTKKIKAFFINADTGEYTENVDKLVRTFKGLFAIIKIITTITGGAFKLVWQILTKVLGAFNLNILDVTAGIGDALVKFQEFITENELVEIAIDKVVEGIVWLVKKIGELVTAFKNLKVVQDVIEWFKEVGTNAIEGLKNGLQNGFDEVPQKLMELGQKMIDKIKEVLGIHSPSTEMEEVGENTVDGLVKGVENKGDTLWQKMKDLGQKMVDSFKSFDFGKLLSAAAAAGIILLGKKLLDIVDAFAAPARSLANLMDAAADVISDSSKAIEKTIKSFAGVLKSISFSIKVNAIKQLAIALAILVGAVLILTLFDSKKVWIAIGQLAVIAAILGILVAVVSFMSKESVKLNEGGTEINSMVPILLSIAGAIILVALAIKMIGSLNAEQYAQGMWGMVTVIAAIGVLVGAFTAVSKAGGIKDIDNVGDLLLKSGAAMIIMAAAVKILGSMDRQAIIQGGLAILAFSAILGGLVFLSKTAGNKAMDTAGDIMLKAGAALLLMAIAVRLIGGMNPEQLAIGVTAILAFSGIIGGLVLITKLAGEKDMKNLGTVLMSMGVSMLLMAVVMRIVGEMDPAEIGKGVAAIAAFGGIIGGLVMVIKLAGNNASEMAATILAMSGAIAILAAVAVLLGFVPVKNMWKGIAAVAALATIMSGLIFVTKFAGSGIVGTLVTLTVAIGVLATVVLILSFIDPSRLAGSVAAISILVIVFSGLIFVTKYAESGILGTLIVLTVAVLALGGVLYLLATLPVEQSMGASLALSTLLLAVSGALVILTIVGSFGSQALTGVALLLLVAVPLLAFTGVLALMSNVGNAMESVKALVLLCTVMTLLFLLLIPIGALFYPALLGLAALTLSAVPMLAFVGVLALMSGIQNAQANAELLVYLMTSMAAVLLQISLVAPLAIIAVTALTMLAGVIVTMGLIVVALGALVTQFPEIQTFIDTGLPIMIQLAEGLGLMLGKFIDAFMTEATENLPLLGQRLSLFMANAMVFIQGAKMVDAAAVAGVGFLVAAILALTTANLIDSVTSFFAMGQSFDELGTKLSNFMLNAMPFITGAMMIKPEMLAGVKTLVETILMLTAANLLDGIASFFSGESALEKFASEIGLLGTGIRSFADEIGTFTDDQMLAIMCASTAIKTLASAANEIPNTGGLLGELVGENDLGTFAAQFPILGSGLRLFLDTIGVFTDEQVKTVNCAAQAIKLLAEASSEIPNSGGLLGDIVGENDLSTFAAQFPILGVGLRGFLTAVGTFTDEEVKTVDCASQAIKLLAEAANEIPNSGGWLGKIMGENDLSTFAGMFPELGKGLKGFATELGEDGFSDQQIKTVECAAKAVKILASAANEIPNSGGWVAKIVGDNNLDTFAGMFPELGKGIKGFADELGTFKEDKLATVKTGIKAVVAITDLANVDLNAFNDSIGSFSKKMPKFGTNIAKFLTNLSTVETTAIKSAITTVKSVRDIIKSAAGVEPDATENFTAAVKNLAKVGLTDFVTALTNEESLEKAKTAGESLVSKTSEGIEGKLETLKTTCTTLVTSIVTAIKSKSTGKGDTMESAGKNLGAGLVKGINAKKQAAYDAGFALGQEAVKGEKAGQESESPSKATERAGKWFGEGLVIGIKKMGKAVYNAGHNMGDTAVNSISGAISRIAEAVDSDIDSQPTIRPVLDLSDVEAGARSIGGMFPGRTLRLNTATVGAVSSSMAGYQNGRNNDVISAIKGLRKDFANMPHGDTYNVNGITYDDGSSMSNAVKDMIREARIERRK